MKPLTVGTSLMLFQQITGQPSVLYYAADIFNKAGIGAGKDATGVSVILGLFKLVMTGVPTACTQAFMKQFPSVHTIRCFAAVSGTLHQIQICDDVFWPFWYQSVRCRAMNVCRLIVRL